MYKYQSKGRKLDILGLPILMFHEIANLLFPTPPQLALKLHRNRSHKAEEDKKKERRGCGGSARPSLVFLGAEYA